MSRQVIVSFIETNYNPAALSIRGAFPKRRPSPASYNKFVPMIMRGNSALAAYDPVKAKFFRRGG
jgi:hypothetical protein